MSIIYGNVKPTFMEIYPDWKYITKTSPKKTVLRAGTPLGANGRIADSSAALGLVVEDTGVTDNPISIVVGGLVDYAKVTAGYGELTDEAISALTGVRLIGSDGDPIVPSGGGLPDYSEASDGDVLSIDNGAPAWTSGGGGGSGGGAWDKWNEQMKEVTFVYFEATGEHTIDVSITCSDGYALSSWECYYDPEIGDYHPYWNEWTSYEDLPAIPNLENYIATLEWNIGLILEAAFAEAHDWSQAQNMPMPAIVCRSWIDV